MLPAESCVCHIPALWQTQKSCVGSPRSVERGVESQGGSTLSAMWCKQWSWSTHPGKKHRLWHPLSSSLNNSASPNSLAGLRSQMRSQSKTRDRHLLRSKEVRAQTSHPWHWPWLNSGKQENLYASRIRQGEQTGGGDHCVCPNPIKTESPTQPTIISPATSWERVSHIPSKSQPVLLHPCKQPPPSVPQPRYCSLSGTLSILRMPQGSMENSG